MKRDLKGYGNRYPDVRWPNGAQLAVSLVLNVEEGAELSIAAGDERNEFLYEVVREVKGVPDYCMESHFEYGSRIGYWRITDMVERAGLALTLNACARALEATPWIAADAVRRNFQIQCHGYRWESHAGMDEARERALIGRCVEIFRRVYGKAPVGWHTKSTITPNTRRLLLEHDFLYDSDGFNDDAPYYTDVAGKPHLVVPYALDTNDMRFFDSYAFVRGSDFADYVIDGFDWLWAEGAHSPRMLSVGLHTRVIGRPARIGGLQTVLRHMQQKGHVWIATREEIARYWLQACPPA